MNDDALTLELHAKAWRFTLAGESDPVQALKLAAVSLLRDREQLLASRINAPDGPSFILPSVGLNIRVSNGWKIEAALDYEGKLVGPVTVVRKDNDAPADAHDDPRPFLTNERFALDLVAKWRALAGDGRDKRSATYAQCASNLKVALGASDADVTAAGAKLDSEFEAND